MYNHNWQDIPYISQRQGFSDGLLEAARQDERVVGLCADLTSSVKMDAFAKAYPQRYFQVGVSEQNMIGVAAGLALSGKIPFAASYAVFSPGRSWDQIRVSVAYSNANVKIIGSHAGLNVGPDGATHQALEDLAIMRVLPNMVVLTPTDYLETKKAIIAAAKHNGPVYIRLGRADFPQITLPETPFVIGKANRLVVGEQITIIACGLMVAEALTAATSLQKEGISVEVISVSTLKPLDKETILASATKTKAVVVVEEAQIIGGLGGAIAELLGESYPVPLQRVGVKDCFGQSGTTDELLDFYGLKAHNIVEAAKAVLKRKIC